MKALLLLCFAVFGNIAAAQAGQASDIKNALATTRSHTMAMLSEGDRAVLDMRYEEALQSSKKVDALLGSAISDKSLAAVQPTLKQFNGIWEEFKATRDKEIIPALFAGERDKARGLAQKVQAGRFKKMNELLDSLPQ